MEDVWIKVQRKKFPSIIVGCMYRHPKAPAKYTGGQRRKEGRERSEEKNGKRMGNKRENKGGKHKRRDKMKRGRKKMKELECY